ncbi:virulence-associated E family protein, partial [Streptococcus gallolyticus subsp. gallolyticus]|nr:virulence-associated E family protein [Streptococcus gallolyticus subsp. gallolyticus]
MLTTEKGGIRSNSPSNVLLAFKADDQLSIYLKHNEFSQEHELTKDIKIGNSYFKKGELPSNFDSVIKVYFESVFEVAFTNQAMLDGMETFFSERTYNPVMEYMEEAAKNWDGRQRINRMFQVYLGADDIELVSKIAEMWLVGAVAKVYDPYVKFDYVLDLVGGQGVGKTSLLQKLGGNWYTDAVTDFSNKDNYDIMLKSLIVNDDEMVASNRMSFAETKAFISKTSLRFRKPYMKRTEEFAKNFVLARTTNQKEYLKDKTGERRFLPIMVNADKQKKHPMEI